MPAPKMIPDRPSVRWSTARYTRANQRIRMIAAAVQIPNVRLRP